MSDPGEERAPTEVPYQSLYRRFRPQRFSELAGQEHVATALRNAARDDKVAHAYLFSGPRGTGKTSTARILAKALNCAAPVDGEPCGVCRSCVDIAAGASMDVHELDAASNNGVDAMRDLVARAALGTPGRWKVYIVDEVHMLSTAASNALLKTLEEPPGHVVFVLATTEPQKVLPTIRSRTQHYEFRLLGPDTLQALLEDVRDRAGLDLPDHAIDSAVRRGRGSARDALSALDQVVAAGVVEDDAAYLWELTMAVAEHDGGRAIRAVASAIAAGRDPQGIAGELAEHLRQGFLSMVAPDLVTISGEERRRVAEVTQQMGLPAVVRAMEAMGRAQVGMRDTPDPRIHVEVALIRLVEPDVDDAVASLADRVERLERAVRNGAGPTTAPAAAPAVAAPAPGPRLAGGVPERTVAAPAPTPAPEPSPSPGPQQAKKALGGVRRQLQTAPKPDPAPSPPDEPPPTAAPTAASPAPPPDASAAVPTRDQLTQAWGDGVLAGLPQRARARFRAGRFVGVEGGVAVYGLPNEAHRGLCEEVRADVEASLAAHFGAPVPMRLVVDDDRAAPAAADAPPAPVADAADGEPDLLDPEVLAAETEPAGRGLSAAERLKQAFPGAEEV